MARSDTGHSQLLGLVAPRRAPPFGVTQNRPQTMGIKNYLIEGVSCAGKTTVGTELQKRDYHVIHGDRELAFFGNLKNWTSSHGRR